MDSFETLVSGILQRRERLWTWQNFKVELTPDDKARLGKHSHPRIDVDILAYNAHANHLEWVECKSYLDSTGVSMSAFNGSNPRFADRFKIFTDATYREVAEAALLRQVLAERLVRPGVTVGYALVAGRIVRSSVEPLHGHFTANGWTLRDLKWIQEALRDLSGMAYDDDVTMMAAKLLHMRT